MDKVPVYPGQIPLDTNILQPQRNMEIALGFALQAAFGTSTIADGLTCAPTSPASMSVKVGQGSIIFGTTVDTVGSGFGSLALDNSDPLVKIGVNLLPTTIGPMTAPGTAGQSQNYLIEASFAETDGSPVVLPYYNSVNPTIPFSGPANSGGSQNTARTQTVNLNLKAGTPATTGSQTTPAVDSGFVGLFVITIANGQSTITSGNIAILATAPFVPTKLGPGLVPGFSNIQIFTSSGSFTVPAGILKLKVRLWGAGGGGGASFSTTQGASAGGGGGGYSEGILSVTPGTVITATVSAAGAGGNGTPTAGSAGGTTTTSAPYLRQVGPVV